MIKSLYMRMILIFIGSITISMILGFAVYAKYYTEHLREYIQENVIASGQTIIEAYEQSSPENLDALMDGMTALPIYSIRLFDKNGKPLHEAGFRRGKAVHVDPDQVRHVLQGRVYKDDIGHGFERMLIGLPFEIKGEPYALFVTPEFFGFGKLLAGFFKKQLIVVLVIGSLFIAVSARFIVRPLQHLTKATRRMAKGDFSIRVKTMRKDEIGQLTASFNQMAHELGMLEQIRRQFVSDVSHEIQSPLTAIKGFTQALMHKKLDEPSRLRLLGIIEEESNRLSRLSENLLQLSSLEYDQLQLNLRLYRLDEQIRKVIIACEPQWSSKQLNIELDLEEIHITADEDKLNQLWTNLIGNSIKFTEARGTITIKAEQSGRGVRVTIADSGIGIAEEELVHIFKPFYKVDKSRTRKINGSGIGLSIVKRIVDLHQGDIQVESREGEGTTFIVIFHP